MQTAKKDVEEMLKRLPEDSTFEDIRYHLYVLQKIRRGQNDIRNGRHYTHAQAKIRLTSRFKP